MTLSVSVIPPMEHGRQNRTPAYDLHALAQALTLDVLVFDVTGDPAQPPPSLDRADRHTFVVPDGGGVVDGTFELRPAPDGSDYRIRVDLDDGESLFSGTRSLVGIQRGDRAIVDFFLTPDGPPEPGETSIRIGDSTSEPGSPSHLIPIVLANSDPVGGFQFDMTVDPNLVSNVLGFEIDPASRLGPIGSLSARFHRVQDGSQTEHVWRIIVASTDPTAEPISIGQDVLCFVETEIGIDATTGLVRVSNAVVSDPEGGGTRPAEGDGTLRIADGS
jgi:hypothetical protein